MSQLSFLRELDADMVAGFLASGMADSAAYTAPLGSPVDCTVMVDRAAQFYNEATGVAGSRIVITLFIAEIAAPIRKAEVVIGGETFLLDQLVERDESLERWVVVSG